MTNDLINNFDNEISVESYNTIQVDDIFNFKPQNYTTEPCRFVNICHMNIRSMNKNFDNLAYILGNCDTKFDFIALSETWINDSTINYSLNDYSIHSVPGRLNKCDGVCIFTRNTFNVENINFLILECNSLILSVSIPDENIKFTIVTIYRSPSSNLQIFLNSLNDCIDYLKHENSQNIIIIGDTNIDINSNTNFVNEYFNLLSSNGFKSYINKPTREINGSQSCIDHIFYRKTNDVCESIIGSIMKTSITDHYLTCINIGLGENTGRTEPSVNTRKSINYHDLINNLKKYNWSEVASQLDLNIENAVELFVDALSTEIGNATQIKIVPHKLKPLKPWITAGLITSIRKRDKMHQKLKKQPQNNFLKSLYKNYRNTLNNMIKKSKYDYYNNILLQSRGNSKKTWECINDLLNIKRDKKIPNIDPEVLNHHFTHVGQLYANKIINNSPRQRTHADSSIPSFNSFYLADTNNDEIIDTISSLRSNSSPGVDNLSSACLKKIASYIVEPLKMIINKCFLVGYFPKLFKVAKVVPLYKSGDKSNPSNYRPISLINNLAKIMEKIIKKRLVSYLNKHRIINRNQYGFKSGISTEDAISDFLERIIENFNSKKKTLTTFLDLAKAFDTVSQSRLLEKMEHLGIRGSPLKLFNSYLTERYQLLTLNTLSSNKKLTEYGLPQGTVLSPILFQIYINDFLKVDIGNCSIVSFADDTALTFTGNSWEDVRLSAENGLRVAQSWLDEHLLTLNASKSVFMTFSPNAQTQPHEIESIKIHQVNCNCQQSTNHCFCPEIRKKDRVKYLGILLDPYLRWNIHINSMCLKIKFLIYKFHQIRELNNLKIARLIYFSYAQAVLQYGIRAWGGALNTHFEKLFIIQKYIIKTILGKPRLYPTSDLFNEFKVLTVRQLYIKNLIIYIKKNKNKFLLRERNLNLNLRPIRETFHQDRMDLNVCRRQFTYLSQRIINLVPTHFVANTSRSKKLNCEIEEWIRSNKTEEKIF